MCGIYAAVGVENASAEIYLGLMHLQHRGQDATGIITYNSSSGEVHRAKNTGMVSDVLTEEKLKRLDGMSGIGHTRYPTVGTGDIREVQPFFIKKPDGIGLCFNGNIVNYPLLKKEIREKERVYLTSNSDAEVLLHLFASEYEKKDGIEGIFSAVERIHNDAIGGYSVSMIIANRGVLVFKDPNGIRPLAMGEKTVNGKKSVAFASESIALSINGYSNVTELKPGEVIIAEHNGKVHRRIIKAGKPAPCIFEWVYFSTAESTIAKVPVYDFRKTLGDYLAATVKAAIPKMDIDVVIPVPDTSRTAAIHLARTLNLPFEEGLIKNRYVHRTFIMPIQSTRENAVKLKLKPIESVIKGKNVLVVDDSIVRGTTSRRIVKLLRETGAKKVYFVSTYPPIKNPCYYGIDFQRTSELIAAGRTVEEIEKEIGADKLIFIDVKGLETALGSKNMCKACVSDEYPTSLDSAKELTKLREEHLAQISKC